MMRWEVQDLRDLEYSEHFRKKFFEIETLDINRNDFKKLAWQISKEREQEAKSHEK